ncbi:MerR family transcriptional regulator [Vallitalea guaymasensis]|uniref:MerR family transcriptional regulator n=1 Tax=Vallitalea guaymasensis TaxID=1185412 RepID=UPI002354A9C0|nr:MerR family transcriptional regulator [Vallitalea guaymasensis]
MNTYRTSQIADIIGIHPNTVRLYEELGLIPKPERQSNGYRIFTDLHIAIFKLARIGLQIEVLQNGLRKKIVTMIKTAASENYDYALTLTHEYLYQIHQEQQNAEEAVNIVKQLLSGEQDTKILKMKRKEVSKYLGISMGSLRNWEMNGLLSVKRTENGYRIYTNEDIKRLKIIRSLRCANYSLESILRMLNALSYNPQVNIKEVLNTPKATDDIISVCDKLIISLNAAENNAKSIIQQLNNIKIKFANSPL